MWTCPDCNEEIEYLDYATSTCGREWGTVNIEGDGTTPARIGDDYESSDSESGDWDGDMEYSCSHCSNSIEIADLIWVDEEAEEEVVEAIINQDLLEETEHNIIRPENQITCGIGTNDIANSNIICKNCFHLFVATQGSYEDRHGLIECPKCGKTNSPEEFRTLMEEGYFNKD